MTDGWVGVAQLLSYMACMTEHTATLLNGDNPLLQDWTGPFGVPPFGLIAPGAFSPGLRPRLRGARGRDRRHRGRPGGADLRQHHRGAGTQRARRSTASTACSSCLAGAAHQRCDLRRSSARSRRVDARHWNGIYMNEPLFRRIDALYEQARPARPRRRAGARAGALPHRCFKRAGAALDAAAEAAARRDQRAAGDARHHLQPERARRRAGLHARRSRPRTTSPACRISCAPRCAPAPSERGLTGKHVVTLSRSSVEPFLQFSARRDLREKAFRAWIARGDNGGATDNKAIIAEMLALRAERARLLGYETFAHYRLDDAMAKTPQAVRGLLDRVWAPARARRARRPRRHAGDGAGRGRQLRARAVGLALLRREAAQGALRRRRGDDQALLPARPHHRGGVRHRRPAVRPDLRARAPDVPAWHPDVRVWEVRDADGRHMRPVLRRLFRAALEAQRRLDDDAARPGEARRRHPPAGRQRHELRQGGGGRADAAVASTTRARCSTSSATRCTACCPTSPIR